MASSYAHVERTFTESSGAWTKAYEHNNRLDGVEYPKMELQWMNHEMIENPDNLTYKELATSKLDEISEKYNPDAREMKRLNNYSPIARKYNDSGRRLKANACVAFEAILCYNRQMIGEGPDARYEEIPLDYDYNERKRWEDTSLEWAKEYFKNPVTGENNIISATVHYDETSPHIHLIVMPVNDDKLNRDFWLGGAKKLAEFNHSYGELMNKEFGLELPKKNSKAKNVAMKKIRAVVTDVVKEAEEKIVPIEPEPKETLEHYQKRVAESMEQIKDTFSDMAAGTWKMSKDYKDRLVAMETKIQDPDLYNERKIDSLENTVAYLKERIKDERDSFEEKTRVFETFILDVIKAKSIEELQGVILEFGNSIRDNDAILDELLRIERERDLKEKVEKDKAEKDKKKNQMHDER